MTLDLLYKIAEYLLVLIGYCEMILVGLVLTNPYAQKFYDFLVTMVDIVKNPQNLASYSTFWVAFLGLPILLGLVLFAILDVLLYKLYRTWTERGKGYEKR